MGSGIHIQTLSTSRRPQGGSDFSKNPSKVPQNESNLRGFKSDLVLHGSPLIGPKGANYDHLCWSQVANHHAIVPSGLCLCQLCFQKTLPMTGLDWTASSSAATTLRDGTWACWGHGNQVSIPLISQPRGNPRPLGFPGNVYLLPFTPIPFLYLVGYRKKLGQWLCQLKGDFGSNRQCLKNLEPAELTHLNSSFSFQRGQKGREF